MADFAPVRSGEKTLNELADGVTRQQLCQWTDEMIDEVLALIATCTDEDVTFVPEDPEANDPYAASKEEIHLSWTLGHVVVHITASAEESAFLAAELARGVENHGRSRYEVPWQTVTTIEECRRRLEESRRMRLSSLELWPDQSHLENTFQGRPDSPSIGPVSYFLLGLLHDDDHLGQVQEIVRQAVFSRSR